MNPEAQVRDGLSFACASGSGGFFPTILSTSRQVHSGRFHVRNAIAVALLVGVAAGFQVLSGAYHCDTANHPDEPAQFLTGLMVFDYLTTSLGTDPLAFAVDYYHHYPKVAFGHWPPMFFVVQAFFFCLFGAERSSALILVLLATAATAACLYRRLCRYHDWRLALVTTLCFLALPLVRRHSSIVLADMLATLFVLLAVFAFADFLLSNKFRYSLAFAVWSSSALLTKGNEAALAFLPPIALLMTGKVQLFKSWKFWFPAAFVLITCAPFYLLTAHLATNASGGGRLPATYIVYNLERLPPFLPTLGVVMVAVSALGALGGFRNRSLTTQDVERACDVSVSSAWVVAFFLFQLISPVAGAQPQYLLPVVPSVILLFTGGFSLIRESLLRRWRPLRYAIAGMVLLLLFLPQPLQALHPVKGYAAVMDAIPNEKGTVVLVSSGTMGEGALIIEQRLRDPHRQTFVLRGSKTLGSSTWNGRSYELRLRTKEEVVEYLNRVPVHFIILDDFGYSREREDPHHHLLRQTLESYPDNFALVCWFPIVTSRRRVDSGVLLYENRQAKGRSPGEMQFRLSRVLGQEGTPVPASPAR